ncbi:hypothetical protein ACU8OS_15680 [Rhizobium leguminosarum]
MDDVPGRVAGENDFLPKLLGITVVDNPNQSHPYRLTQLSQRIGLPSWRAANHLLNRITDEKGIDLRSSDNRYHCKIRPGTRRRAWLASGHTKEPRS